MIPAPSEIAPKFSRQRGDRCPPRNQQNRRQNHHDTRSHRQSHHHSIQRSRLAPNRIQDLSRLRYRTSTQQRSGQELHKSLYHNQRQRPLVAALFGLHHLATFCPASRVKTVFLTRGRITTPSKIAPTL